MRVRIWSALRATDGASITAASGQAMIGATIRILGIYLRITLDASCHLSSWIVGDLLHGDSLIAEEPLCLMSWFDVFLCGYARSHLWKLRNANLFPAINPKQLCLIESPWYRIDTLSSCTAIPSNLGNDLGTQKTHLMSEEDLQSSAHYLYVAVLWRPLVATVRESQ